MKSAVVFLYVFCLCIRMLEAKVPELRIESADQPYALALIELSVESTIRGHLAKTEFILTYKNNEKQDLRGDFLFPLPDNAILTDIGLYFGDRLRHSVIVERNQGRRAFEEIVHRRVDPALAEWMAGTTFRLDVYPIPARNIKRVYVTYQQELTNENDNWKYQLDLGYKTRLQRFHLSLHTDKNFTVQSNLSLLSSSGAWSIDKQNFVLDAQVSAVSSGPARPTAIVEPAEEEGLYYVSLPVKPKLNSQKISKASEVILFWDNSGSSVHQNAEELFAFLRLFLEAQKNNVSVRLIPFHQEVEAAISISDAATDAGFQKLRESLGTLPPIGSTNLVELFRGIAAIAGSTTAESRIVIVTDGLDSFHPATALGSAIHNLSPLKKPVLVLSAADRFDSQIMNQVAANTGGWFLNLRQAKTPLAKQLKKVMHSPVMVTVHSSSSSFTEIAQETYQFEEGEILRITAKSRNVFGTGSLTLRLSKSAEDDYQEIVFDYRMLYDCRGIVRTTWAASRLRQIMQIPGNHDQEYLELGKKYHLLTPRTSLIVLETWQDYQQYGIPMPPDMLQEYQGQSNPPAKGNRIQGFSQASIIGRITDDKGGPLPGVSVKLQSNQGLQQTTTTGPSGAFSFARLPAGVYSVTSSLLGFTEIRQDNVRVSGGVVQLDLTLRPTLSEEFVVVAETPLIDTKKTGNSFTFDREYLDPVPRVNSDRTNIAGSESGQQTGFFARGANNADQAWNYDAVRIPTYYDMDAFEEIVRRTEQLDRALLDKIMAELSSPALSVEQRCRLYVAGRLRLENFPEYSIRAVKLFEGGLGLRVLFDVAEFGDTDPGILRGIARRVMLMGRYDYAKTMTLNITQLAPNDPQSWRDLGLIYAKMGQPAEAEEAYRKIFLAQMDNRHRAVIPLAAEELQRLLNTAVTQDGVDLESDPSLDLKIVLHWDSNYTDVDLHIVEPSGEEVFYDHPNSAAGAKLTDDITAGYGPEIYTIRHAPSGKYQVFLNYYGADQTSIMHSTTANVSIYQRNAEGRIVRSDYSIVLTGGGEKVSVASITVH